MIRKEWYGYRVSDRDISSGIEVDASQEDVSWHWIALVTHTPIDNHRRRKRGVHQHEYNSGVYAKPAIVNSVNPETVKKIAISELK